MTKAPAQQSEARKAALRSELDRALGGMLDPIVVLEAVHGRGGEVRDFLVVEANGPARAYRDGPSYEVTGTSFLAWQPVRHDGGMLRELALVLSTAQPWALDGVRCPSALFRGAERTFDLRAVRLGSQVVCTWRDVTERNAAVDRLVEVEFLSRLMAEGSGDALVALRDGEVLWASPGIERVSGLGRAECLGQSMESLVHEDDVWILREAMSDAASGHTRLVQFRVIGPSGEGRWIEASLAAFCDAREGSPGVVASLRSMAGTERTWEEYVVTARHDALTGLVNRGEAVRRLDHVLDRVPRTGTRVGVLFCDVDDFACVNDAHGRAAGDEALRVLAGRIARCIRSDDLAARIGGDEFLVVLPGIHTAQDAVDVGEKIRLAVSAPLVLTGGVRVHVTCSVGVAMADDDDCADDILRRADAAMLPGTTGKQRPAAQARPGGLTQLPGAAATAAATTAGEASATGEAAAG